MFAIGCQAQMTAGSVTDLRTDLVFKEERLQDMTGEIMACPDLEQI